MVQGNVSRMRGASADVLMYLNEQIPLPYVHLLELMVTIYTMLLAPLALVPKLMWMSCIVSPFLTLFFYGFYVLGTSILLDPFRKDEKSEEGFNTRAFFTGTTETSRDINAFVPLPASVNECVDRCELCADLLLC